VKSRMCPTPGCGGTCRKRPLCPACWVLVEGMCLGKFRHPGRDSAVAAIRARPGSRAYHCQVCRAWHSGTTDPGTASAAQAAGRALAGALTPGDLAGLAAWWSPRTPGAGGRRHINRGGTLAPLGQAVIPPELAAEFGGLAGEDGTR
jgi:hypothetical protein